MVKIGDFRIFCLLLISFLSVFLIHPVLSAEESVKVVATVDQNTVSLDEEIQFSVLVTSSSGSFDNIEPKLPSLRGFNLINSASPHMSISKQLTNVNGRMEFLSENRIEFNYLLVPQKIGEIVIDPVEVVVEGKPYKTKPITITVLKPDPSNKSQNRNVTKKDINRLKRQLRGQQVPDDFLDDMTTDVDDLFNQLMQRKGIGRIPQMPPQVNPQTTHDGKEAFFIQLDVDKTEVYEGEQITANWTLFTKGSILQLDRLKFPDMKGFWKETIEELPTLSFSQAIVNGVVYHQALMASYALFPIKSGKVTIDEYKIKATVQVPVGGFGGFGVGQPYTYTRTSQKQEIKVKPLPTANRPANFSSAVGNFEVTSTLDGNQFPVNQPFSYKIRFEGAGNAKMIELPALHLPSQIEVYDTKSEAKFFKNGRSYKEFEILMIPRAEGELEIPSLEVSLFDPEKGEYYSRKTQSFNVKIINNGSSGTIALPTSSNAAIDLESANSQKSNKKKTLPELLLTYQKHDFLISKNQLIWVWLSLFSLLSGILFFIARKQLGWGQKKKNLNELLKQRVKNISNHLSKADFRKVGVESLNLIYLVLGEVIHQGGVATQEIQKLIELATPSVRHELDPHIFKQIDYFQLIGFGPEIAIAELKKEEVMKKHLSETEKLLTRVIQAVEKVD